ncbi:prepilin-type N-terminal cleavage/methylation domain-containing protein [Patescibacteria group bacterium]|nr:prepilin-type N-terminal cleavage/methylation domain-containing protein [Patescibacteria group bacterium]
MNFYTRQRGFTLIETLVGSVVFLLVALSAYKAFGVLMDAVTISQAKLAGTTLANEKLEIIRNLPYTDVGIVAGLPVGKIQRNETIIRDNYSFDIQTTIRSVDDPFDGIIEGNPPDTSPADYKLIDLDLICSNCKTLTPLSFTTLVAPHALETASTNGALFIRVFDASGIAIPNASIHLVNTQTNPDTIIDETTDNAGWMKIVDAPIGINAYNIIATKSGFTQDQTYPPDGAAGANPVKPDATVVQQQVTLTNFSIDRTSSLIIETVDSACVSLPSIGFSLTGTKLIGTPSVLKYPTQNFTTNTNGSYTIPIIEWDTYSALLTSASYDLAGTTPLAIFNINPNEIKNLQLVVTPHINRALLVSVKTSDGVAIDGATVHLQKSGFNQTKTTNSGSCATPGQVFWNGLGSGTYTLTVSKVGYQNNVSSFSMSSWQNKIITLMP